MWCGVVMCVVVCVVWAVTVASPSLLIAAYHFLIMPESPLFCILSSLLFWYIIMGMVHHSDEKLFLHYMFCLGCGVRCFMAFDCVICLITSKSENNSKFTSLTNTIWWYCPDPVREKMRFFRGNCPKNSGFFDEKHENRVFLLSVWGFFQPIFKKNPVFLLKSFGKPGLFFRGIILRK
jgi:hypothetical protein